MSIPQTIWLTKGRPQKIKFQQLDKPINVGMAQGQQVMSVQVSLDYWVGQKVFRTFLNISQISLSLGLFLLEPLYCI